jgi:hypothetical protein
MVNPATLAYFAAVAFGFSGSVLGDARGFIAGVFAGGDVVSGPKTIIDAVAAGRRAAASIHEYLSGSRDAETEIFATVRYRTSPERKLTLDLASTPRTGRPLPIFEPTSFSATQIGFDAAAARAEASRCFRCDAVYRSADVDVVRGRGPGRSVESLPLQGANFSVEPIGTTEAPS